MKRVAGWIVGSEVVEGSDHYSDAGSHDIVDNDLRVWDATAVERTGTHTPIPVISLFGDKGVGAEQSKLQDIAPPTVWFSFSIYLSVSLCCSLSSYPQLEHVRVRWASEPHFVVCKRWASRVSLDQLARFKPAQFDLWNISLWQARSSN